MARPKQSPESKRQFHIGIRLDESEYGKIRAEAEKIGVTFSAFVRAKALRGFIRIPKQAMIDTAAINQLSKLGGLLKQFYTATGGFHREETAVILGDIRAIMRIILSQIEDDRKVYTETEAQ
jgi:hypothetical protein